MCRDRPFLWEAASIGRMVSYALRGVVRMTRDLEGGLGYIRARSGMYPTRGCLRHQQSVLSPDVETGSVPVKAYSYHVMDTQRQNGTLRGGRGPLSESGTPVWPQWRLSLACRRALSATSPGLM